MRNWKQCMIRVYCLLVLILCSIPIYAGANDWIGWPAVKLTYGITPRLSSISIADLRLRNNLKEADRWRVGTGLRYRVLNPLFLDAAYELHYANSLSRGWEVRHRYYVGVLARADVANFRISLRERLQQTFMNGSAENFLRSQCWMSYGQRIWPVAPFFAVELFQPVGSDAFFSMAKIRYRPGLKFIFSKNTLLNVYYTREYQPNKKLNMLGAELSLSF